jgi:glycerate dehydrogenase
MKRRPVIVNTARGGLVDEAALRALDAGWIAVAGFDVVDGELPRPDNPLMRGAARHNVILTPHVPWASDEAQQALADQLSSNIEDFIAGRPTNLVHGAY